MSSSQFNVQSRYERNMQAVYIALNDGILLGALPALQLICRTLKAGGAPSSVINPQYRDNIYAWLTGYLEAFNGKASVGLTNVQNRTIPGASELQRSQGVTQNGRETIHQFFGQMRIPEAFMREHWKSVVMTIESIFQDHNVIANIRRIRSVRLAECLAIVKTYSIVMFQPHGCRPLFTTTANQVAVNQIIFETTHPDYQAMISELDDVYGLVTKMLMKVEGARARVEAIIYAVYRNSNAMARALGMLDTNQLTQPTVPFDLTRAVQRAIMDAENKRAAREVYNSEIDRSVRPNKIIPLLKQIKKNLPASAQSYEVLIVIRWALQCTKEWYRGFDNLYLSS